MKIILTITTRMVGYHLAGYPIPTKSGEATFDVSNCPVCGGILKKRLRYPDLHKCGIKEVLCKKCERIYDVP